MQINTSGGQTKFKWNKTTHLEMTMLALQNSSIDDITKRQVARYAQMPDLQRQNWDIIITLTSSFQILRKKASGQSLIN